MMIISEKRSSMVCARAMKRAAAAMPRWTGVPRASGRRVNIETGGRDARGTTEDAKWRRVSGMTEAIEKFMDRRERKAAIERLIKWLKKKTRVNGNSNFQSPIINDQINDNHGNGNDRNCGANSDFAQTGMSAPLPSVFLRAQRERAEKEKLSLTGDWDFAVREWAVAQERSEESLCRELGISHGGLTRLTKEFSGTTAQETVDGFKMGRLNHSLKEHLREVARALWGVPGDYVKMQCIERPRSCLMPDGDFFHQSQQKLFEESEEEMIERRSNAIFAATSTIDLQSIALECGFGSAARLKAACVNIFGKSIKAVLKVLAREVLEFYLCAEQKALRDLASREPTNAMVMRARTLYWDDEKAPSAPFMDRWSAAEFGKRDWLVRMADAFG